MTGPCKIKTETLREHQLDKLRKLCIPKIVLLLHTVMSEMNEHAECVALADVIASEDLKLYKVILFWVYLHYKSLKKIFTYFIFIIFRFSRKTR